MSERIRQFQDEIDGIFQRVGTALAEVGETPPASDQAEKWQPPKSSRLAKLARLFQLDPREVCLLQCLVAVHVAPELVVQFRALSELDYLHEALVQRLFGLDPRPIYASDSALNVWQLARARDLGPGRPFGLEIDMAVVEWLAGKPGLEPALQHCLVRLETSNTKTGWPAKAAADTIKAAGTEGRGLICELTGVTGRDAERAAGDVAGRLGMGLWSVTGAARDLGEEQILRLHRFVKVQGAALIWQTPDDRSLVPRASPSARLQFVSGTETSALPVSPHHRTLTFDVPVPDRAALRKQLRKVYPKAPAREINRVATLKGLSAAHLDEAPPATIDGLARHLVAESTRALKSFALPLATNLGFDDLVLTPEMTSRLRGLVSEIELQSLLWDDAEVARVYAQEKALTILLQGPPGTGKTLTAKVLAGQAGLPLFKVDVASLTSKYRGETTKNMRALFQAANRSGAVLFIDEFDAVASKRTEGRNEIAKADNAETSYFLQLIENAYEGTAIFATNRPMDIDEAMMRRIRHTLDFQPPGEEERRALWHHALAPFKPDTSLLAFSSTLAPVFEFSGARIKAVVLNAFALTANQGGAKGASITLEALRQAVLAEARVNGRMPAPREMKRIRNFGTDKTKEGAA